MLYAIITGATQGIGKAIADRLLSEGFSIAVCARTKNDLLRVEKEWKEKYPTATIIAFQADLGEKEDVLLFANAILAGFPQIDILVNNAGLFEPGKLADEPEGHLEKLMAINLYSAYHLTRCLLPSMKKQEGCHIFNMCSVASLKAYPNGGSYGISKYAMMGFSENLRQELMPHHIRVTALCLGATNSRSWQDSGIASEKMMDAKDVAEMVWTTYSLSDKADVETIVMRPLMGDI